MVGENDSSRMEATAGEKEKETAGVGGGVAVAGRTAFRRII
jgi:hypothetical protein